MAHGLWRLELGSRQGNMLQGGGGVPGLAEVDQVFPPSLGLVSLPRLSEP